MTLDYTDPYAAASDPQLPPQKAWGQVKLLAEFCVFEDDPNRIKSDGTYAKRLTGYNPNVHKAEQKVTNIALDIEPLDLMKLNFPIGRKMLRESREWAAIVWPSLKGLGINNLRELEGRWVQAEMVPTGRTYVKDGETKQLTTLKFLAVFPDANTCRTAYLAAHPGAGNGNGNGNGNGQAAPATTAAPAPVPAAGTTQANGNEKAVALRLVEALIRKVNGDEAQLAAQIAAMPVVSRHFTAKSPEVVQALDAYLFEKMKAA